MKYALIALTVLSLSFPDHAEARRRRGGRAVSPTPPACGTQEVSKAPIKMSTYTAYMPGRGGINGNCNGGASKHKGFRACQNTLDKFIKGKAKFIHVAAQQRGGSAGLFGCWATTKDLEAKGVPKGPNACHIMAVADRYAMKESEGRRGTNGRIQGKKVDIEVDSGSRYYHKLGGRSPASGIQCIARLPGVTNRERSKRRVVQRIPDAHVYWPHDRW
jgi:hypothetical protein